VIGDGAWVEHLEKRALLAAPEVLGSFYFTAEPQTSAFVGERLAVDGDWAVLGARLDDNVNGANAGAAYVFQRQGEAWVERAKLLATDGVADDRFGNAVAISGNTIVVGASIKDGDGALFDIGAAYVFVRGEDGVWTQQAKLLASDGTARDRFGDQVAIDGDTVLIGAWREDAGSVTDVGAAYVYQRSGTSWTEIQKLIAPDAGSKEWFGHALAIDGAWAFIGADTDDTSFGVDTGSVYVYQFGGGTWSFVQKIIPDDARQGARFGQALAFDGETLVVGAPRDDNSTTTGAGSAYAYTLVEGVWTQQAKFLPATPSADQFFGAAVAVQGTRIVVGAGFDEVGGTENAGSAVVYVRGDSGWDAGTAFTSPTPTTNAAFGGAVAVFGERALVTTPFADTGGNLDAGGFYFFDLNPPPPGGGGGGGGGEEPPPGGGGAGGGGGGGGEEEPPPGGGGGGGAEPPPPGGGGEEEPAPPTPVELEALLRGATAGVPLTISYSELFNLHPERLDLSGDLTARIETVVNGTLSITTLPATIEPGQSFTWTFSGDPGEIEAFTYVLSNGAEVTNVVRLSIRVSTGVPVSGTATSNVGIGVGRDAFFIVANDDNNRPVLLARDDDTWRAVDLTRFTELPPVAGDIVAWVSPIDGLGYAAIVASNGLYLLSQSAGSDDFTVRNLNAEIPGAPVIVGQVSVFHTIDAAPVTVVAGRDGAGDVVIFRTGAARAQGGTAWSSENLYEQLRTAGATGLPVFVSPLTSYVTSWNGLNIAGLTAQGDIWTVWTGGGFSGWNVSNLSDITGAPRMTGAVTPYLTPWGGINLAGTEDNGQILVTWWVPDFGGVWRNDNLTDQSGGPSLVQGTTTSYVTSWGGLNVIGRDGQNRLIIYWWSPSVRDAFGEDRWQITVLSDFIAGAPKPAGELAGGSAGDNISIAATTDTGNIGRYYWSVGDQWRFEDVTAQVR
jgi:hypothetical protein